MKISACFLPVLLMACKTGVPDESYGTIERLDAGFDQVIAGDAVIERLADGFEWSEGPVWVSEPAMLLFSDVPANTVYKWTETEGLSVYLTPSGYTGSVPRGGEPGSNGLLLDAEGRLVLCQHGDRRVARMKAPLSNPRPAFVTLADRYHGKRLSSPNDAVYDAQGNLYFTDPPYGLANDTLREIPYQGVYRLTKNGEVKLLVDSLTRPNGVALSPDQTRLYVSNSDPQKARWYEFRLAGDSVAGGRIFHDASPLTASLRGLPDGLKVDGQGHIFATGPGGIFVFEPGGRLLGKINLNNPAANCALTDDGKVLYITADMDLLRIRLRE